MTITREERERVAKLLGCESDPDIVEGYTASGVVLDPADIDRVAQALRDAAPQWREVTETEPAIGVSALVWPRGEAEPEVANRHERGWWNCADGNLVMPEPTHWMPLPAPPEVKPAPAPPKMLEDRVAALEAELRALRPG